MTAGRLIQWVKRPVSLYRRANYPLLPVTRLARFPMRAYFHFFPLLRIDNQFSRKRWLLEKAHDLLVRDIPVEFRLKNGCLMRSADSLNTLACYYCGTVEDHLLSYVRSAIKPGFVFVDAGAHHGAYTLEVAQYLRRRNWTGTVHAYEPYSSSFDFLSQNVAINSLGSLVSLHNQAVSNTEGTARLMICSYESCGNTLEHSAEHSLRIGSEFIQEQVVETVALDNALKDLARLDMIKLDIQAGEPEALEGASGLVRRFRPALLVEAPPEWESTKRIRQFLQTHDYAIYGVTKNGRLCDADSPHAFVLWDWVALPRETAAESG
jgi:FkbM family methyltransferase